MVRLQLTKNENGQSLVEILLAMGLMSVFLPALLTGFVASREAKPQNIKRFSAGNHLREVFEVVRNIKKDSWSNVVVNGTYHPEEIGGNWDLTSGTENTFDDFERSVVISNVERTLNGDIVTSGGIIDPGTKRFDIEISWLNPISSTIRSTFFQTRYLNNTTWTQSTQAEFTQGTNVNVSVLNNNGGEVELTPSTGGTWTSPTIVDDYNSPNNTDGYTVFTQGNYLFLGSDEFEILDLSDPFNVTLVGSTNVGATIIYDIYVDGNYAYLATNGDELVVIDISNKASPTVSDSLDLNANNDAYGVAKIGNYAYLARDRVNGGGLTTEFYSINVSDPSNVTLADSLEYNADVNDVAVSGSYAYLATDGNELEIVNISDPNNMVKVGNYNAPSGSNGENIAVSGNYAYLVTENNGGGDELYIINVSNPTSPSYVGSYDVGAAANGVYVMGDYVFIASDNPGAEFQVIDATDKSNPVLYGTTSVNKQTYDVIVSGNYAYLAVADQTRELVVIEGGFGGGGYDYQTNGTYESQTFDATAEVLFNHIGISATEPTDTDIQMQIATNNDGATWNFVGPDGTNTTYFDNEGGIPLDFALARYFRFKAFLTGDGFDTPILEDVTINYTP